MATIASKAIKSTNTKNASNLAIFARAAIIILSSAMALGQMGIASNIINMAFGLLLGAIAVALALAFGIGGREYASKILEDWRTKQ